MNSKDSKLTIWTKWTISDIFWKTELMNLLEILNMMVIKEDLNRIGSEFKWRASWSMTQISDSKTQEKKKLCEI